MKNSFRRALIFIFCLGFIFTTLICPAVQLDIPPRDSNALSGSEFVSVITDLPREEREENIYSQIAQGNVPDFMRTLCEVSVTEYINGQNRTVVYYATPDYLAIGSNQDYFLCPMTPILAQQAADLLGCSLPTRKMSDDIHAAADLKMNPDPISPSGDMTTVPVFDDHNDMVWADRQAVLGTYPLGTLVAGDKKDVVITPQIYNYSPPDRVAIYGWHYQNGDPIQPLYLGHSETYADYSHGIRLVEKDIEVDGQATTIEDVLGDSSLCDLLSDEGVVTNPAYPPTTPPEVFPFTDIFPSSGRELSGWIDRFTESSVISFSPASPDGDGYVLEVMDPVGGVETTSIGFVSDTDYFVQCDIYCDYRPGLANDGYERVGIFIRDEGNGVFEHTYSGGGYCYGMSWDSDNGRLRCFKSVGGTITDFCSTAVYRDSSAWRTFAIEAEGDNLTFYCDDDIIAEATDSTFRSGRCGIGYHDYFATNSNMQGTLADNFVAGLLTEPTPTATPTATPTPTPTPTSEPSQTLLENWEGYSVGTVVMFQSPGFSGSTTGINSGSSSLVSDEAANDILDPEAGSPGSLCDKVSWEWTTPGAGAIRLTTALAANKPNPLLDLNKGLSLYVKLPSGEIDLQLQVRETGGSGPVGADGGMTGDIERTANPVRVSSSGEWQYIYFDIPNESWTAFTGDGNLDGSWGTLEALYITAVSGDPTTNFTFYIDDAYQGDEQTPDGGDPTPTPTATPVVPYGAIDFDNYSISSYAGQDVDPSDYELLDDGYTYHVWGNTWKSITIDYNVTADTVMEFDYKSDGTEPEIGAIAIDDDNSGFSSAKTFQLYGTQSFGISDYNDYASSDWKHYEIPVGQHYTGLHPYLGLINDFDGGSGSNSYFRYIQMYESTVIKDNDDGSPDYTETGSWSTSSSNGYDGGTYRYAFTGGSNTATWDMNLPASGSWAISVYYRAGSNRADSAKYIVQTASGPQTVYVNQQQNNLSWITLGTWTFDGGGGSVQLDAEASSGGDVVIADAVKAEKQ
mgnify:CR=1 FL=1